MRSITLTVGGRAIELWEDGSADGCEVRYRHQKEGSCLNTIFTFPAHPEIGVLWVPWDLVTALYEARGQPEQFAALLRDAPPVVKAVGKWIKLGCPVPGRPEDG
jgi:hypothetical protein